MATAKEKTESVLKTKEYEINGVSFNLPEDAMDDMEIANATVEIAKGKSEIEQFGGLLEFAKLIFADQWEDVKSQLPKNSRGRVKVSDLNEFLIAVSEELGGKNS